MSYYSTPIGSLSTGCVQKRVTARQKTSPVIIFLTSVNLLLMPYVYVLMFINIFDVYFVFIFIVILFISYVVLVQFTAPVAWSLSDADGRISGHYI